MLRGTFALCMGVLLMSACGPSAEQMATMTAEAWTPTPPPTATATPLPYEVTVTVLDSEGRPIPWAEVSPFGAGQASAADENGQVVFSDFGSPNLRAAIVAQGFIDQTGSANLVPGPNQLDVTMERTPFGLLPTEACGPDEEPIFMEDLQDGQAQGLALEQHVGDGWSIGSSPDGSGNKVLTFATAGDSGTAPALVLPGGSFEDVALRGRIYTDGIGGYQFFWHDTSTPYETSAGTVAYSNYMVIVGTSAGGSGKRASGVVRFQDPVTKPAVVARPAEYLSQKAWHYLEISTYQDNLKVWLDGKDIVDYVDTQPLPPGGITIAADELQAGTKAYYDDLSVCRLTGPFQSLYTQP